jgi:LCP family protein required for cell wall assembly
MRINKKLLTQILLQLAIAALVLTAALGAGVVAFESLRRAARSGFGFSGINGPNLQESQATPDLAAPQTVSPRNPSVPDVEPELAEWDGAGRVTILLLGLDYRDWDAGNDYSRSDTMILLTLDPLSRTAGILSIPRDMWTAIPGFQHGKINTAYYLGDAYKLPGGGPGLAVKTVEQFLGVPIHYYAQIDFGAFVRFIDEIGGVKIDIPEPITVDLLGSGSATKKNLPAGVQTLPGEWALAYARARYTEGGDFDRARRQQQVILGIRNRIISFDMLPILISKSDVLYRELASGVHTNLNLDEVIKLALLAIQVPDENIRRGVIDQKMVLFGRSPDNLAILIPIIDKIHVLRDEIFGTSGVLSPLTPGTAQERMAAENASLVIRNGSQTEDLGRRTRDYLFSQGANIQALEAGESSARTRIIDYTGNPHMVAFLAELMGVDSGQIEFSEDQNAGMDVVVILGDDWARNNSMP